MRTSFKITIAGIALAGLTFAVLQFRAADLAPPEFLTTPLHKGSVSETISSTGTIQAVGTVEVGTQVSGTVAEVLADYNDKVRPGQALVVLDQKSLQASLDEANAQVMKAEAQLEKSKRDLERSEKLSTQGHLAETETINARTTVQIEQANLLSAQANLRRAQENLKHATIRSPIYGSVLKRNVEVGQTVAASLSTPTLFVIAEDLSALEIIAGVDESDIASIHEGQDVHFSVQAYPDSIFTGKVSQIRLQPDVVQNVVTYQVVIQAKNMHNLLLPGMTATVDFILQRVTDVFVVPNSALRFQADSTDKQKRVWILRDTKGARPKAYPVTTGLTDGSITAIIDTKGLQENDLIITGTKSNGSSTKAKKKSSFGFGPPH